MVGRTCPVSPGQHTDYGSDSRSAVGLSNLNPLWALILPVLLAFFAFRSLETFLTPEDAERSTAFGKPLWGFVPFEDRVLMRTHVLGVLDPERPGCYMRMK